METNPNQRNCWSNSSSTFFGQLSPWAQKCGDGNLPWEWPALETLQEDWVRLKWPRLWSLNGDKANALRMPVILWVTKCKQSDSGLHIRKSPLWGTGMGLPGTLVLIHGKGNQGRHLFPLVYSVLIYIHRPFPLTLWVSRRGTRPLLAFVGTPDSFFLCGGPYMVMSFVLKELWLRASWNGQRSGYSWMKPSSSLRDTNLFYI